MNNEDERRRAGMVVSNLLGRQQDLTPADPLAMMRELSDALKKDNEPPEYQNFQDNILSRMENSAIGNLGGHS